MIPANDPSLKSWVEVPHGSDFPIQNLPFGIFSTRSNDHRVGVAIGNHVLDLSLLTENGYFDDLDIKDLSVFYESTLNDFISLGRPIWRAVREKISQLLRADNPELRDNKELKEKALILQSKVKMSLPVRIGDYTDFYSSIEHASNVGAMFRDPQNPLLPNWKHLPVAYHGRSSSIVVSGTDIRRPLGQTKADDAPAPTFAPTKALDFELELAFVVGKSSPLGKPIPIDHTEEHIFGLVLFNDWSARDVQRWEYVPLGPFLAKNFASTISPWIVTLDALEPFRVGGPVQEPAVLPYLKFSGEKNFDVNLSVTIQPENSEESEITHSNFKYMYWNMNQQLAHHTSNGCNVNVGDMLASGTISGQSPDALGCLLELTKGGKNPVKLKNNLERRYIEDGDSVILRGYAEKDGVRIGFGEARGKVLPALGEL